MLQDLSKIHQLVGKIFHIPKTQKEWDDYRLSDEQVSFFNQHGFLGGVKLLDEWQIEVLQNELEPLMKDSNPCHQFFHEFHSNESVDPTKLLFHALGAWRVSEVYHDVLWNPRFLMAAYQLLGDKPVRFWHDQLFCKPPHHGGVVAWHQDYSYWTRTKPVAHLTCWCGLDDATVENGCLQYVPGSHRWGLLDKPELAGDMMGIMDYLTEEQKKEFKPVPVKIKAGYGIFHHPLTLHGSRENRSDRPRRAFVINTIADGVISDTDMPLLEGIPPTPKGEPLQGQFFPLLFNR